jgi:hypothetical protein
VIKRPGIRWIPVSDDGATDRRTAGLAGFAVTLFIIVLALLIVRKLQVRCLIENCIMAGGSGCQHVAENLRVSRALEELTDNARTWIIQHDRNGP